MKKHKKTEKKNEIRADFESIKKQDIKKLQKTFEQFFGKTSEEIKERSKNLKRRFYLLGAALVFFVAIIYLLINNVKFVQF